MSSRRSKSRHSIKVVASHPKLKKSQTKPVYSSKKIELIVWQILHLN